MDVVVRSKHVGYEVLWLLACKHWKSPVTKLHVLRLREIVNDLGADRGILLCEAGFQTGAIEAANLTVHARVRAINSQKGQEATVVFRELYRSMQSVHGFGRLGKLDFLTMIGKLDLAPIEADSVPALDSVLQRLADLPLGADDIVPVVVDAVADLLSIPL